MSTGNSMNDIRLERTGKGGELARVPTGSEYSANDQVVPESRDDQRGINGDSSRIRRDVTKAEKPRKG
ncbi:unnamed protein product [Arabis nemorensis]|uniref:Uncharacterized protein n=1 Tax=Arabis nemorensis TaxID=586526 RepID=A0A565B256_9BRAS|nr:unnamed protein product [Arabis nemorensis]